MDSDLSAPIDLGPVEADLDESGRLNLGPVSDEELVTQALAAHPIDELPDDAVSFDELTGAEGHELLPEWYMPRPGPRARILGGWRSRLVVVIVGSIVLVDAAGFCVIYGRITIG